jgi:DNA-binding MarR family transcriptional regulator
MSEDEKILAKHFPKEEVLRKASQRYTDLKSSAVDVFLNIKRVAKGFECANQDYLEPYGLSEGKFYVLCDLFSEEVLGHENPSPSEIADHLGVTRATITGLLDGLERDGYLERHDDNQDRRALTIRMTDKTRAFIDRFIPEQTRRMTELLSGISEEEKKTLISLLSRIDPS